MRGGNGDNDVAALLLTEAGAGSDTLRVCA